MIKYCPNCKGELTQSGGVKKCNDCEGKYYILEIDNPKLNKHDVVQCTFSKQSFMDAYLQGYRKKAYEAGLKHDCISEKYAKEEFENWFTNLYLA